MWGRWIGDIRYMEKLLDKLSSYQLFNYLFPGIIFINLIDLLTSIQISV